MIEIACQIDQNYGFVPYSQDDQNKIREYRPHQIVKVKISGVRKPRSYQQLKWFHAMCKLVSENTEDENWNSVEKVKMQVKVLLQYYDPECVVVSGGRVHFRYRSFGYADLPHFEACKIFDRALAVMAKFLGCGEDELLSMSKQGG